MKTQCAKVSDAAQGDSTIRTKEAVGVVFYNYDPVLGGDLSRFLSGGHAFYEVAGKKTEKRDPWPGVLWQEA